MGVYVGGLMGVSVGGILTIKMSNTCKVHFCNLIFFLCVHVEDGVYNLQSASIELDRYPNQPALEEAPSYRAESNVTLPTPPPLLQVHRTSGRGEDMIIIFFPNCSCKMSDCYTQNSSS